MLTLNETFAVPDPDHAWSVINDLDALVPCVPGARVKTVDSPQAVKAEIAVRMGAMGMTFTGPVTIESTDPGNRSLTIKANTRETLGQSYATGDITIRLGDGEGTIDAIANVGGKAAGMGEGVIVNVLTDLVKAVLGEHRDRPRRARRRAARAMAPSGSGRGCGGPGCPRGRRRHRRRRRRPAARRRARRRTARSRPRSSARSRAASAVASTSS